MTSRTLRFQSPPVALHLSGPSAPFSEEVDGWRISEHFSADGLGGFGSYHVSMELEVPAGEDAGSWFIDGEYHAHALEKAWLYATGVTLSGRGYDYFLHPARLPSGWSSNAEAVVPDDDWELLRDGTSFQTLRRTASELPLKSVIRTLWALSKAHEIVVQLTAYHLGAVTTLDPDLPFLSFAQGLEIARELLPGTGKDGRAAALPTEVSQRLPLGLDWLFNAANQRRQTRHSIDKRAGLTLKPEFEEDEARVFLEGANLVIHHVVTNALNLPLAVHEKGRTLILGNAGA